MEVGGGRWKWMLSELSCRICCKFPWKRTQRQELQELVPWAPGQDANKDYFCGMQATWGTLLRRPFCPHLLQAAKQRQILWGLGAATRESNCLTDKRVWGSQQSSGLVRGLSQMPVGMASLGKFCWLPIQQPCPLLHCQQNHSFIHVPSHGWMNSSHPWMKLVWSRPIMQLLSPLDSDWATG